MRHRTKTQTYSTWLRLIKQTSPKTGRHHYSVVADPYVITRNLVKTVDRITVFSQIKKHFDPGGNKGPKDGYKWKYRSKQEAEKLITLALLKWGG